MKILHCQRKRFWWRNDHYKFSGIDEKSPCKLKRDWWKICRNQDWWKNQC